MNIANPFYAPHGSAPVQLLAKLPIAPINASPVPHLTSLYHDDEPGTFGNRSYPGNCGGNLIRDLLQFFGPKHVFDPMSGSGTCRDVCQQLGIDHWSSDIHDGFDLTDVLKPGGKLAILMGDYNDREAGFVPLTYHTKRLAFESGLIQTCTDIIRFSHGASSSRKVYRSSFIPGLHDVCTVFTK
jgi:hypothetical protein